PLARSVEPVAGEKTDDRHGCRLRARHDRPRGRAAEQGEERAALHSITSSAVASSTYGTVTPSALAAFMLTTNSNLVGRSIGRSPGRAPRRPPGTRKARRR